MSAADGHQAAVRRFDPHGVACGQLVIAAAMAVLQPFYPLFAHYLARRGYVAWTKRQRYDCATDPAESRPRRYGVPSWDYGGR